MGWHRLVCEEAPTQGGMISNSHIQDLLLPISRNSILLLRPNRQILFPGNFYPFMSCTINVCAEDECNVAEQIITEKCSLSRSRFQAIFPSFISKSSGVENSILKEKWWGGGESWMKKRGVYGVIIQPPPKNPLRFLRLSRLSFPPIQMCSKIIQAHDEDAADFTGDGRSDDKHLIRMRPLFPFLLPFLGLVLLQC